MTQQTMKHESLNVTAEDTSDTRDLRVRLAVLIYQREVTRRASLSEIKFALED